jgi:hypothetical protein
MMVLKNKLKLGKNRKEKCKNLFLGKCFQIVFRAGIKKITVMRETCVLVQDSGMTNWAASPKLSRS